MYDVVVVGGGPAGSRAAALLAKDHDVLVIEEHRESGTPVQCAGVITKRTAELSGTEHVFLNELHGARVIFPDGNDVTIRSDAPKAVVIDRAEFDRRLADAAVSAGAEYRYSTRYLSHTVKDGVVTVRTDAGDIESKLIIGADGHSSKVASSIPDNAPNEYIRGIEYDVRHRMEDQNILDIRIGNKVAPGLFTWEVPMGEITRVGLCTSWSAGPPMDYMRSLMRISGLDGCEIVKKYCGKVPIGMRRRSYGDHMLLIGDAAGQVKPVSAGGLYPLMASMPYLVDTVNRAFEKDDLSEKMLSGYEKGWKGTVGRELKKSYRLRSIYVKCNDDDMNQLGGYIRNPKINGILNDVDIDHPNGFAYKAFGHPATAIKLGAVALRVSVRR